MQSQTDFICLCYMLTLVQCDSCVWRMF